MAPQQNMKVILEQFRLLERLSETIRGQFNPIHTGLATLPFTTTGSCVIE